ncbi:hypothetical protein C0214_13595 [Methylobacterium sp. DM1]|nr:hypothetical protein C0214_13595 [Methylobacterium sp. DM1]
MRSAPVFLSVLFLTACQTDRTDTTTFRVREGGQFEYKATAGAGRGLDDPAGERVRLGMLADWLKQNSMCPNGYSIVSRVPTKIGEGVFGPAYDVNYTGRCN